MKTFTCLFILLVTFLPGAVLANAYVHGTVKRTNGQPVANYLIHIEGDSGVASAICHQLHTCYTNANGTYSDTLTCSGAMTNVRTWVINCNGAIIIQSRTFSAPQTAESNFIICDSLPNNSCSAAFTNQHMDSSLLLYRFNSTASTASSSDNIVSRKWNFDDGDSLSGNTVIVEHTYAQPGAYNVCLRIKTTQGCERAICQAVTVFAPLVSCHARFIYQLLPATAIGFPVKFNSSITSAGDSLVQRLWKFGDGTIGSGIDPRHVYTHSGSYIVCLTIVARSGCRDSVCWAVTIPPLPQGHCEAVFSTDTILAPSGSNPALQYIYFNSTNSHGSPVSDSIVSRRWTFGDGTSLTGNRIISLHGYAQPGTYTACLRIETASRCLDSICKTIIITTPIPTVSCQTRFTTTASGLLVTFNNQFSTLGPGDIIINRTWTPGNGAVVIRNVPVLTYQYAAPGVYNACLTIHTRLGCTVTWCKPVAVVNVTGSCVPYFSKEQVDTPVRTMRYNSSAACSQVLNDSIISRKWEFGDGQVLTGNAVTPLHTYLQGGTYNVCLTIYTAHCDKRWCHTVQVLPLTTTIPNDSIAIVNLYPIPVTTQLNAVIYSAHSNVQAQLSIYDVYGVLKWTSNTVLPQGNSTYNIPTNQLASGPYVFKVTTIYGMKSRNFYKMN